MNNRTAEQIDKTSRTFLYTFLAYAKYYDDLNNSGVSAEWADIQKEFPQRCNLGLSLKSFETLKPVREEIENKASTTFAQKKWLVCCQRSAGCEGDRVLVPRLILSEQDYDYYRLPEDNEAISGPTAMLFFSNLPYNLPLTPIDSLILQIEPNGCELGFTNHPSFTGETTGDRDERKRKVYVKRLDDLKKLGCDVDQLIMGVDRRCLDLVYEMRERLRNPTRNPIQRLEESLNVIYARRC